MLRRVARKARRGEDIRWHLQYLFLPRSHRWYSSLFQPRPGQVAGEMTPDYCILDAAVVKEVNQLMPDTKIVYMLRDPIDRTWSQANRKYRRLWAKGAHADEKILHTFMSAEHPHQRSSYCNTLQIWEEFFPKQQIFVGFFEQITTDPVRLLKDIAAFLDVDSEDPCLSSPSVARTVNPGSKRHLPKHWGRFLAQRYYDQTACIHRRFNNQSTANWLAHAQQYL